MPTNTALTDTPKAPLYLHSFAYSKAFIRKLACLLLLILSQFALHAQNCLDNAVYVTPGGTGMGSRTSPANIYTALSICRGDTSKHFIKLSTGTYTLPQTLEIPSDITIDGNYEVAGGIWKKSETPGCTLSVSPYSEEIKTVNSSNKPVTVGHYIGIRLDSVKNIVLKDFVLQVHKTNNYRYDMTSDGDGKSVYGIYGQRCQKIYLINLHIVTDVGGEGLYGYNGLNGASAHHNIPGQTLYDPSKNNASYRPKSDENTAASYAFRAGGAGGQGGRKQNYYRCLSCASTALSSSTFCALENPLPAGGRGGKNGGTGGSAGEGCEMDCYYEYYKSKAFIKEELKELLNLPVSGPKDPNPKPGENGRDGTGIYNGRDYNDQTNSPYDDLNYYYIPGAGEKGGDGFGGAGGGGGGAGGIRTLGLVPEIPGLGDYNYPAKMLGLFNKTIILIGGNDVCNAQVVNGSTEGGVGGAGGEGGEGGGGGRGGGGSFGVWLLMSKEISDMNCIYTIGEGGRGGTGGHGGTGGDGAPGLFGNPVGDQGWSFQGARGGTGGKGGNGSRGQRGSHGRSIAKIGVSSAVTPYMMSDITNGCTNSAIALYTYQGGFLYDLPSGAAWNVKLVQDKPNGSSFAPSGSYTQVYATDTGSLPVGYSHTNLPAKIKSPIRITVSRPLPVITVPAVVCLGAPIQFSAETAGGYSWKLYDSENNLIHTSDKKSFSYTAPATGEYTVGYQAYDNCCGLSIPVYHSIRISVATKPEIIKIRDDVPYCYGTDSTRLLTRDNIGFSDVLLWTDGSTGREAYAKEDKWYTVTLTNTDGCTAKSDSVRNYVLPLPVGKPVHDDLYEVCNFKEAILLPKYEAGASYNFYNQNTNKKDALNANKYHYKFTAYFDRDEDVKSYYIRKTMTHYLGRHVGETECIADEFTEVKLYKDKTPPKVLQDFAPRSVAANTTDCGRYVLYDLPKGYDNCMQEVYVTAKYRAPDYYYHLGKNTDTIQLMDMAGNILDHLTEIIVEDRTAPVITNIPELAHVVISNDPGKCSGYYPYRLATAKDNCSPMPELQGMGTRILPGKGYVSAFLIAGAMSDSVFNAGTNIIRQIWSDSTGNISTYDQTIIVRDTEKPVLTCNDITVYVQKDKSTINSGYNTPIATDNCTSYLTSSFVSGFGQVGIRPIGTTEETWQATDASGNIGTCTFRYTVADTIRPDIDCRSIYAAAAAIDGTDSAQVLFPLPAASDNSGIVTVTTTGKGSGDYFKVGEHMLQYTATDNSGNTARCDLAVIVYDMEAPDITCPSDINVANDAGLCGASVNFSIADAPDNDGTYYTPFKIAGLESGSVFPVGTTQQVYRVTDASGNRASCVFYVTVTDNIAPVFDNCPGNQTVTVTPALCSTHVALPVVTATDNSCAPPSVGFAEGSPSGYFPVGTTAQIYRATDQYGNSATCAFEVTVVDNTTLTVACPQNVELSNTPGLCGRQVHFSLPTATPFYGCLEWKQLSTYGNGDFFPQGAHQVIYQATALGQTQTCSFSVTINDTEVPVISRPDNIVTHIEEGHCGKTLTFAEPIGIDNCTNVHTQRIKGLPAGSEFPIGTTTMQYITFDILNKDTATFYITVQDTIAPVISKPARIVVQTDDLCGTVVTFAAPTATDNSSCYTITQLSGLASGDLFPVGSTEQLYVVRDAAGNTDTARFAIEVVSEEWAKFKNCPADVVVMSDNDLTQVVWYDIPGRVACNGLQSLLISGKGSGATFPAGTTYETYLLTDASGKTDTCSFRVIVTEKIPPYISIPEPLYYEPVDSICGVHVKLPVPYVDDYGGSGLNVIFNDMGPNDSLLFFPVGYSLVTWTAVDNSGNRAEASVQVFVEKSDQPRNPLGSQVKVCEGSPLELYPDMTQDAEYTYSWAYYDNTLYDYVTISTDSIFRIPSVKATDGMQYVYRVTSKCNFTVYQREFLLVVEPAPVVTLTGLDTSYCAYDSTGKTLSFSPQGGMNTGSGVLVGNGLEAQTFYPQKAALGENIISYVYYDSVLTCPATSSLRVTIFDKPVVNAFIDTAYCLNHIPVVLNDTNSVYSGPGISGTTFTPALAQEGIHTIQRTVTENGCINSGTRTVRINGNIPDAAILTQGPFCSNQGLIKLETTSPNGTWEGEAIYTDTNNVVYFNVQKSVLGANKISHKIISDVCASQDSVSIDVKSAYYDLPFTFDSYCHDHGQVHLDTSGSKSYMGYGIEDNIFYPAVYDTTTTALYGVATVNEYGCIDTTWRAMAVLKPEIINPDRAICHGKDSVLLSLSASFASVKWDDNSTAYTRWVDAIGSYWVELHNSSGCSNTDTFYVVQKQLPANGLINDTRQLFKCVNTGISLTVDSDYTNYQWSTGESDNSITVINPGRYTVSVTDRDNCLIYDSILVQNHVMAENNLLVKDGGALEAIAAVSYQWYRDGVLLEHATDRTLSTGESGDYFVAITDANGCTSNSDTLSVLVTTITDRVVDEEYLIYPNPGKGKYTLKLAARPEEDLEIAVFNAVGHQIETRKIESQSVDLIHAINIEKEAAGVYWVYIRTGDRSKVIKLVKIE